MNKVKRFWRKNKSKIINTLITIGSFALGYAVCACVEEVSNYHPKLDDAHEREGKEILDAFESAYEFPSGRQAQKIDEDIFTRIAPEIEDYVLTEGLDEGYIEADYFVDYPKFGDAGNGYYTAHKKVEVNVKDVTE